MNNLQIIKLTWVDARYCPICNKVTMFRYSNEYKKCYIISCTGSWDRSEPGCGFKYVYNSNDYAMTELNMQIAMEIYRNGVAMVSEDSVGVMAVIVIDGDSMYPTLRDGDLAIVEMISEEGFVNGDIYSILLYGNQPNCCRVVYDHERNGFILSKDNKLFEGGIEYWVKARDIFIVGRVVGYNPPVVNTNIAEVRYL